METICVYILIPRTSVKKIRMDKTLKVITFHRLFTKNLNPKYIYQGEILNENYSLEEINFKDGETIVACIDLDEDIQIWKNITKDSDDFNEKVQNYLKMDSKSFALLKDRKMNNNINKLNNNNSNLTNLNNERFKIPEENKLGPIKEPLPILF